MNKDLERVVKIIFEGDDKTSRAFKSVERRIKSVSTNVGSATAPLADLSLGIVKAETGVLAFGSALGVLALGKAKEFQSAMIDLEKVVGNQPEALAEAKEAAYKLADIYGESTTTIIQSIAGFKQAGFSLKEAAELTRDALNLMIAGDVSTDEASTYIVKILKGFGKEAAEASRAVDILNEISNKYATNVQELAEGMAELAPVAATMGLSMEQTAGLLTPIIEVFQSGSEASRGLRTGLLRLAEPTAKIQDELGKLNISIKDNNGVQKSAYQILIDVSKAFGKLSDSQKVTTSAILAGKDQAAKMVKVFDNLREVTKVTADAMGASGSAMVEVEKRLESAEIAIKRFFSAVENVSAKAGDKYIDSATGMINASTEIAQALQKSIDEGSFDVVFKKINEFFKGAEKTLLKVAKNLPEALKKVDFSDAMNALDGLGRQLKDSFALLLGGQIDLSSVEGLSNFLQKLVNMFENLTRFSKGFLKSLDPLLRTLGALGNAATDSAEKGEKLGKLGGLATLFNTASKALAGLNNALWALATASGIKTAVGLISSLSGGMIKLATASLGAKAGVLGAAGAIGFGIGTIARKIPGVDEGAQKIIGLTDKLIDFSGAEDRATQNAEAFDKTVQAYIKNIGKFGHNLDDLREKLKGLGYDIDENTNREIVLKVAQKEGLLDINYLHKIGNTRIAELQKEIDKKPVKINADDKSILDKLKDLNYKLNELPKETLLKIEAAADTAEAQLIIHKFLNKKRKIEVDAKLKEPEKIEYFQQIDGKLVSFKIDAETSQAVDKIKKVEDRLDLPAKLRVELEKAEIEKDIEQIKANASVIRESFKYKAELNIAEIEANSQKVKAIMEGVGTSVSTAGNVLGDIFGSISDLKSAGFWNFEIEKWIKEQNDIQKEGLEIQKKLAEVESKYMEEKTRRMEQGEALITVDGQGLQPHLEAFMWEILKEIQIRTTEEGVDMLLGIP